MPTYAIKQAVLPLGATPPPPATIAAAIYPAPDLICTFAPGAVDFGMPGWSYLRGNLEHVMDTFLTTGANLRYFAPLSNYYLGAIGEFFGAFAWLATQATPFRFQNVLRITRNVTHRADQPDFWIRDGAGNYTVLECKSTTDVAQVGLRDAVCAQLNASAKGAYVQLPVNPTTGALVPATYRLRGQRTPVNFTPPANRAVAAIQYLRDAQLTVTNQAGVCPAGHQTCVPDCLAGREVIQVLLDSHAGHPTTTVPAVPQQLDAVFHFAYQAARLVQLGLDQGAGVNFLQAAQAAEALPSVQRWESAVALTELLSERVSEGGGVERPVRGVLNRLLQDAPAPWRQYVSDHKREWGKPIRTGRLRKVLTTEFWAAPPNHPLRDEQVYLFDAATGDGWFARQLVGISARHVRLVPDIKHPAQRDQEYGRLKEQLIASIRSVMGDAFARAGEPARVSFAQGEARERWEAVLSEFWATPSDVSVGMSNFSMRMRLDADGCAVLLQEA